jgi:hypothetical protein
MQFYPGLRDELNSSNLFVNNSRFGIVPQIALSMDRDFDPELNVNVLSTTLVTSYRAFTFSSALVCASNRDGEGLTCFTNNVTSRNLKTAFESTALPNR